MPRNRMQYLMQTTPSYQGRINGLQRNSVHVVGVYDGVFILRQTLASGT